MEAPSAGVVRGDSLAVNRIVSTCPSSAETGLAAPRMAVTTAAAVSCRNIRIRNSFGGNVGMSYLLENAQLKSNAKDMAEPAREEK